LPRLGQLSSKTLLSDDEYQERGALRAEYSNIRLRKARGIAPFHICGGIRLLADAA